MCLGTGMDEGGSQRSMRVYVPSMGGSLCSLHSSISLLNSVPHLKLKKNQICEKRQTSPLTFFPRALIEPWSLVEL